MGNEASLEGEGAEGATDGGARRPASLPASVPEDLSRLSDEERKQIAVVVSRTQQEPPGAEPSPMPRHAWVASGWVAWEGRLGLHTHAVHRTAGHGGSDWARRSEARDRISSERRGPPLRGARMFLGAAPSSSDETREASAGPPSSCSSPSQPRVCLTAPSWARVNRLWPRVRQGDRDDSRALCLDGALSRVLKWLTRLWLPRYP